MLEIVYAENGEQFLCENSEQFYLMQKTDFMNAVSRFEYRVNMMCRGRENNLRRKESEQFFK